MRRLASSFLTIWFFVALPSLIVRGLVVTAGPSGPERFGRAWHWVADRLAYPRLLAPLTDPSWQALESGPALGATLGFAVLVALWATMLALPLALIAAWWHWMQARLARPTYAGGYAGSNFSPYATDPGRPRSSPLSALYLITIPVALIAAAVGKLFTLRSHPIARLFIATAIVFGVTVVVVAVAFTVVLANTSRSERGETYLFLLNDVWYGYLDTLQVPRVFNDRFIHSFSEVLENSRRIKASDWPAFVRTWYRHAEFRTLVWVTAVRHALLMVTIYLGYRLIRRVVRGGSS